MAFFILILQICSVCQKVDVFYQIVGFFSFKLKGVGGSKAQWLVFVLTDPGIPKKISETIFLDKIVYVAKVN